MIGKCGMATTKNGRIEGRMNDKERDRAPRQGMIRDEFSIRDDGTQGDTSA